MTRRKQGYVATMANLTRLAAGAQAAYLVASGAWPILHRSSFEAVTGRKQEFWLVRTIGGLAMAAGASLGLAALEGRKHRETVALAIGTGFVFGVADLRAARTESRIYLGDTLLQLAFASIWLRDWKAAPATSS